MKAENNIGGLLGKSSRLLSNRFNYALLDLGLTVEQWSLLAILWTQNHMSQKELQSALLKDKASVNSLLNNLIKAGFVTKAQNEKDKRSFIVSLTSKGKDIKCESIPIAMQTIGIAVEGITKEDLEVFMSVTRKIIVNLTKEKK